MSTLKKLLALTLALAMVLSVSVFAGNYSADTYADADKIAEDCKDAVEVMYALEIMKGNTDGTFNPEGAIKRSEMAKIIYVVMNGGKDDQAANYVGNSIFSDVPANEWYNGYVNYCAMTKKIQGYDGKFDPNGTLTVAAAAKMLLTAIGYDADAYGFVGPNWEANVLTVAHEAGLLEDVATVLTGAAQRQWVAKMVMNSLGAYCYKTIAAIPGNGVLGNYWVGGTTSDNLTTFGEKYMNVSIKTGYLVATTKANLDATNFAEAGTVTFKFGDAEVDVKGTGLTAADLGQQFTVVLKDGAAKSVRNTGKSVVGEAAIKDVTAKLTYATSDNNEKNRYEFTIGDLTGKLNVPDTTAEVKVLDIEYNNGEKLVKTTHDAAELKGFMSSEGVKNNTVKAIDKDADGDIDYIIYTPVEYAKVTKVGTSNKYGDYIKLENVKGNALSIKGNANLYVEDLINCEDELFVNALVKYVWNIDTGMFDVELLETAAKVKLESRKLSKNEFTFDGVTYNIASNGFITSSDVTLKKEYNIAVDGDLLVAAGDFIFALNGMDEINEQLAVLVSADVNNNGISNVRQVELLTIDNEIAWYDYDYATAKAVHDSTKATVKDEDVLLWTEIAPNWLTDVEPATWGTLVYVYETEDGVYVEPVEAATLEIDGAAELVTKVAELADGTLKVTATKATFTEGTTSYRVAYENKFFAKVGDEYTVITMADLEADTYINVDAVALVKDNTYYNSIVGGYLVIDDTAAADAVKGYLNVVDFSEWDADADYKKVTALVNGADETVEIKVAAAGLQLNALKAVSEALDGGYGVYQFVVNTDGEYVLSYLEENFTETLTPDEDLELWYGTTGNFNSVDFSKYEYFNLQVVTKLRKEVDAGTAGQWETVEATVEYTDAESIVEFIGECEALEADHDYTYEYTYKMYGKTNETLKKDIAVVIVYVNMIEN